MLLYYFIFLVTGYTYFDAKNNEIQIYLVIFEIIK